MMLVHDHVTESMCAQYIIPCKKKITRGILGDSTNMWTHADLNSAWCQ